MQCSQNMSKHTPATITTHPETQEAMYQLHPCETSHLMQELSMQTLDQWWSLAALQLNIRVKRHYAV